MAKYSRIEWTDATWSPVTGCAPISEGCQNCYARRMANRLRGRCGYPADDPFRVTLHPERLEEPLKWKKPRRVFVCSMGDLFHEDVPFEFVDDVFLIINACPEHTFIILTKRPDRMKQYFDHDYKVTEHIRSFGLDIPNEPHSNVWLGVTAENQQRADERIPILLQIPAAVRFVSVEPMLGPVDLSYYLPRKPIKDCSDEMLPYYNAHGFNWVVCGGETGPGARPIHPDWVRSLVLQCKNAGVPFFFKQHGEWLHETQGIDFHEGHKYYVWPDESMSFRVGKKQAGRFLDGRTWDEMPEV